MFSVTRLVSVLTFSTLVIPLASAQAQFRSGTFPEAAPRVTTANPDAPPLLPLPAVRLSERGAVRSHAVRGLATPSLPPVPGQSTVFLPLSSGLSMISLPLRTTSEKLADIFPNLPAGSRVWVFDAAAQQFVEGFDNELPPGRGCVLFVPVPTILTVNGEPNSLSNVSVDLEPGWNLVGVPYDEPLARADQLVYVDNAPVQFNDAVDQNAIGPDVYTMDSNGYDEVPPDGSFEPLHAYWVWSGDGGKVLELAPKRLGSDLPEYPWWGTALEKLGNGVINHFGEKGVSTLLQWMGFPDSKTSDLADIKAQLDNIAQMQRDMNEQLKNAIRDLKMSQSEILLKIGEDTYLEKLRSDIETYYDSSGSAYQSLNWFAVEAAAGHTVPTQYRTEFASNVVEGWKINKHFGDLKKGITAGGLLDNFADQVIIGSGKYDLMQRYLALEDYFNGLLAYQVKAGVLIMNAYGQLGSDPSTAEKYPAPKSAADWKTREFDPAIKEETDAFLRAVEKIALAKARMPSVPEDDGIYIPDDVQAVLGRADFFAMQTLEGIDPTAKQPGIRVRVFLSPGLDLPSLLWRNATETTWHTPDPLPELSKWRETTGPHAYDNWIASNGLTPEFNITNTWRVARTIIPVQQAGNYAVVTHGAWSWWDWAPLNMRLVGTSVRTYDTKYVASSSGTLFGSITIAERPKTSQILNPCSMFAEPEAESSCSTNLFRWSPSETNPGVNGRYEPCGVLQIKDCLVGGASVGESMKFTYRGTIPAEATWTARGKFDRGCKNGEYHFQVWEYDIQNNARLLNETVGTSDQIQNFAVTFQPNLTYKFRATMSGGGMADGLCSYSLSNIRPLMLFP